VILWFGSRWIMGRDCSCDSRMRTVRHELASGHPALMDTGQEFEA
jgi:hypothetical protein